MTPHDFERIKPWLIATDLAMLTYWAVTAAKAVGWVDLPAEWLYSNAHDPVVVAWNWSFFPLDLVFSVTGLTAAWLYRRGHAGWQVLVPVSLVLTWCAGFMALSFWAIRLEFDPAWWAANLFLVLWPMAFFPNLWRATTVVPSQPGS